MDDLFGLLITIALFGFAFSNKKKKKAAKKKQPDAKAAAKPAVQAKIPFSKEEWAAFLKEQAHEAEKMPASAKAVHMPASPLHLEHDEPEGTVSTQGESEAEHAEHRMKVIAAEQARQQRHETLQELRRMNRRKLRSAVVMSEVLGKPVSLRHRG